jgi:hypothetical protein
MSKKIKFITMILMILSIAIFGALAEESTTSVEIEVEDDAVKSVPAESTKESKSTVTEEQSAAKEKTREEIKAEKEAEKQERNAEKEAKLDKYQARLFKRLELTVDGYTAAAAIPVIDMYRDRMLGSGAACIVTGSLMAVCCPLMMAIGGYFAFDKDYGHKSVYMENGCITVDTSTTELSQHFNYFLAGAIVFSMGSIFGVLSLIITPMCSIYFSKAHKSRLVLKRLKRLSMLQGIGLDYRNDGDNEKVGLSYGIRI